MATNDQKQQARIKREQAQAAALAAQKRNRNIQILGGLLFAAAVVVILVVIIGGAGNKPAGEGGASKAGGAVEGIAETKSLLAGIEQDGLTLGDPKAPVTIVEFLDVQCPFCRVHQIDEQPRVISQLVKTGKARLTAQPVALPQMGEDSEAGRVVALRLAKQDLAWNFLNLFYWNQGQEGQGYVTDEYLDKLVAALPQTTESGTKPAAGAANRTPDEAITTSLEKIDKLNVDLKITGTPSFAIGKTGQPASTYEVINVTGDDVAGQLIAAVEDFEG